MANNNLTTSFHMTDGTSETVTLNNHVRDTYRDEYTAEALPKSWVQAATHEELEYFNKAVWKGELVDDVLKDPEAKIIGSRWVICNKKMMQKTQT